MVAPDETTFAWLEGRRLRAARARAGTRRWRTGATWPPTRTRVSTARSASTLRGVAPHDHLGHQPRAGDPASMRACPTRPSRPMSRDAQAWREALDYMGLAARHSRSPAPPVDRVFIGSCTNSRLLGPARAPPRSCKGRHVAPHVEAWVVPGSERIKRDARSRRPAPDLPRGRLPMARAGLLAVRRRQRRTGRARAALRVHVQPQLRRPPGPRRPHPPGQPGGGGGGAIAGASSSPLPARLHQMKKISAIAGVAAPCRSPTSTPTPSSGSSAGAVPAGRDGRLGVRGALPARRQRESRISFSTRTAFAAPPSWLRVRTSVAAVRARWRSGPCRAWASTA